MEDELICEGCGADEALNQGVEFLPYLHEYLAPCEVRCVLCADATAPARVRGRET